MIQTAFEIGILPQQLYEMSLWEFNACVKAHNKKTADEGKRDLMRSWQTAAFTGAAFAGKLKSWTHYVKEEKPIQAPALTEEEMRSFDERYKKMAGEESGSGKFRNQD